MAKQIWENLGSRFLYYSTFQRLKNANVHCESPERSLAKIFQTLNQSYYFLRVFLKIYRIISKPIHIHMYFFKY